MSVAKLSRSALEQFTRCPRCFYLHRRLGVKPPPSVPLTLAAATDALLKNEFDAARAANGGHPLWEREGLNVRAFKHPSLEDWRRNTVGIQITHERTGMVITGAVDDIWEDQATGQLHIVDYKSTSKVTPICLDTGWGPSYKRQLEIYQWLFRHAGFGVHPEAYILYVNGSKAGGFFRDGLVGRMRFAPALLRHVGSTDWVEDLIVRAVDCLRAEHAPESGAECAVCQHVREREKALTQR